jgi:hypothetical protein
LKRSRGRGRRPQQNNHNRSFDSTGPDVKIRGTAAHVYEKYLQLARDANSSGDRVMAENYLQHAEHYFRILMAAQAHQQQQQAQYGAGGVPQHQNGGGGQQPNGGEPYQHQQHVPGSAPSFSLADEGDEGDEGDEAA